MKRNEKTAESVTLWPGVTAAVVIALIAFVLSFDALRLLFVTCGINPMLSWGGPVCVDGTILLCTWASWGFRKGRIRNPWYPWMGFILFSAFSVMGNALHAWLSSGGELPDWASPVVSSVPPVALMYSTHLVVIIAGDRLDKIATATGVDRDDGDGTSVIEPSVGAETGGETEPAVDETPTAENLIVRNTTESGNAPDVEPAAKNPYDHPDDLWDMVERMTRVGDDADPKAGEADPDGTAGPADTPTHADPSTPVEERTMDVATTAEDEPTATVQALMTVPTLATVHLEPPVAQDDAMVPAAPWNSLDPDPVPAPHPDDATGPVPEPPTEDMDDPDADTVTVEPPEPAEPEPAESENTAPVPVTQEPVPEIANQEPVDPEPAASEPVDQGPVSEAVTTEPADPGTESPDPMEDEAAAGDYPDDATPEDRSWFDWARGLAAAGEHTSASKAVDAGLPGATSASSAKRRLRRMRDNWPEVFS